MEDAATRLGKKLAALDLEADEAAALLMLLEGEPDEEGEVEGFAHGALAGVGDLAIVRPLRLEVSKAPWYEPGKVIVEESLPM